MLYQRGECGCGTRARPIESKLAVALRKPCSASQTSVRRDGRVAEGARLESVFRGNSNVGSNPTLSASPFRLGFGSYLRTKNLTNKSNTFNYLKRFIRVKS